MKAIAMLIILGVGLAPAAMAQDDEFSRGSVGVFVDYLRHGELDNNMLGVGGRIGFGGPNLQFEGELGYHWARAFTEGFTDTITGDVTFEDAEVRILHGMFGPKVQTSGAARVFGTVKAGFINFRFDDPPVTPGNIIGQFEDLRSENTRFVLYPGVGFDASAGPIGIRFDIGDEIYWWNGARHNLRITVGPQIRF